MPRAFSPASKIADLICADATFDWCWRAIGVGVPVMVTGNCPSRLVMLAPIAASGVVMRAIGRLLNEASPTKVAVIFCPATTPISNLTPVPELPRSSGVAGDIMP